MSADMSIVEAAIIEARAAAAIATREYLQTHGEGPMCGFAWLKAKVKGNTKLGRAMLKNGFSLGYNGGLEMWNPSGNPTQCISAKEAGAIAAAIILRQRLDIPVYPQSRLD